MHPTLIKRHLSFHKRWDAILSKIEALPNDALEEFDQQLNKLRRIYYSSSIRLLCNHLQIQDAYTPKLDELQQVLDSRVRFRFDKMHSELESFIQLMGNDKQSLELAVMKLRLLAGFQKRWTNIQKHHVIIDLQRRLRSHHNQMFQNLQKESQVTEYRTKLAALEKLGSELQKFYDWYCDTYLRLKGDSMMPVDFLEQDPKTAPLEHCIKVPDEKDIVKMESLFNDFVQLCKHNDIMGDINLSSLRDYDRFLEYFDKYSISSDKSEERLKAAVLDRLNTFHTIISDANHRNLHRSMLEKNYLHSFAAYFAPVDEIIRILNRGYIDSDDSLGSAVSSTDGIPLTLNPHIHDGDMGFIFPLTKVISKHEFFHVESDRSAEINVIDKDKTMIDIRDGVFIAPKEKLFRYHVGTKEFHITGQEYFMRFFEAMASRPPAWFDPKKLEGWLSRHCIFYDDNLRESLLNMLEDRNFISVMSRYTDKAIDNLAFYHVDGSLVPTGRQTTLRFSDVRTGEQRDIALNLFTWRTK